MKKSLNKRLRELFINSNEKNKTHYQIFVCELMNNLFVRYKNKSKKDFEQYLNRDQCGIYDIHDYIRLSYDNIRYMLGYLINDKKTIKNLILQIEEYGYISKIQKGWNKNKSNQVKSDKAYSYKIHFTKICEDMVKENLLQLGDGFYINHTEYNYYKVALKYEDCRYYKNDTANHELKMISSRFDKHKSKSA